MASEYATLKDIQRSGSLNPVQQTRLQQLESSGMTDESGRSSGNLPDFSGVIAGQRANNQAFLAGQQGQQQDFLNRYNTAIGGQEKIGAMADRLGTELGLPNLRQNAFNLQQTLTDIPQVRLDASRGMDINANQLARQISAEQGRLSPLAERATAQQQFAENALSQRLGYGQAQQQKELLPFEREQTLMSDRQAREATLYSQENTNELNGLIARMQTGEHLSIAEMNRATELAKAENEYEIEKQKLTAAKQQNMVVPYGGALYNTQKGEMVYNNPRQPKAGGGGGNVANYLTPNSSPSSPNMSLFDLYNYATNGIQPR